MQMQHSADIVRYKTMTTAELRDTFVLDDLFRPGEVSLTYSDIDRGVIGSAVPLADALPLPTHKELASSFFTERREVGFVNIGGSGTIRVDGDDYHMDKYDSLYVGRGNRDISMVSADAAAPAKFYFVSYPAHADYPTRRVKRAEAKQIDLGATATSNKRTIYQSLRPGIVESCQLVMGFTMLEEGSVWNTFPPHTHRRRSEFYMYFDMAKDARVFHFMGESDNIKPLILKSGEVALSPIWSLHSGAGTSAYTFIWSMGGENQDFDDMDHLAVQDLT